MNLLAIDTSNRVLGIAIIRDGNVLGEHVTNLKENQTARLMPALENLMKEIRMTSKEIDKIIVAKGPGSYTGIRIGVSTAKALAWSLDIPVVGVSSLEILACKGRFFPGPICTFFDARRGTVFTGLYQWKNNELTSLREEKNVLMDEALSELVMKKTEVLFLSPDISLFKEKINQVMKDDAIIPEEPYHIISPSNLAFLGEKREISETHALVPNYLRLAEAEAKWKNAQREKK